ncbi:MAG: urease accessory protein UreD [Opitutaceae bacterium]|nr:urease accessory protein UreD [Opitutaceae bacterium]
MHLVASAGSEGRTQITRQSFRAPFHISKPYWDGAVLQVQVVNPTAGILEGDRLELEARVEPGAALLVTTPAAARAFMMRSGAAACRQVLGVAAGGWLEYQPEPLYPHRDADYVQATRLEVDVGGEAAYFDALAPGRVGRGERWAWRRLRVSLDVHYGGEPVLRECLDGDGSALAAAAEMHRTPDAFFGTLVLMTERLRADDPVWEAVRALHGGGRWVGASALRRGGWVVRVIAPGGQALRDTVADLRRLLAAALPGLASDLRKL